MRDKVRQRGARLDQVRILRRSAVCADAGQQLAFRIGKRRSMPGFRAAGRVPRRGILHGGIERRDARPVPRARCQCGSQIRRGGQAFKRAFVQHALRKHAALGVGYEPAAVAVQLPYARQPFGERLRDGAEQPGIIRSCHAAMRHIPVLRLGIRRRQDDIAGLGCGVCGTGCGFGSSGHRTSGIAASGSGLRRGRQA